METGAFWALRYKTMQNHMEITSTSNCWIRNMRLDQKSDAGHIQSYWWLSKLFKEAKNMRYWQPLRLSWLAHFGYVGTSNWATRNICFCVRLWLRFCSRVLFSLAFDTMLTSRQTKRAASHESAPLPESNANLAASPPTSSKRSTSQISASWITSHRTDKQSSSSNARRAVATVPFKDSRNTRHK